MPKVLIDVRDADYKQISQGIYHTFARSVIGEAIKNGTVLPKGYGRLIDAYELVQNHEIYVQVGEEGYETYAVPSACIFQAPTIVEADKENADAEG